MKLKFWNKGSDRDANLAFQQYIIDGDMSQVLSVLRNVKRMKKISFQFTNEQGNTVIMLAIKHKRTDILHVLLRRDMSAVMKKNNKGKLPLHQAAGMGALEMVQMLLDCGADVEAEYAQNGMTALMIAAKKGFNDIVQLLLKYGATATKESSHGKTAAEYAKTPSLRKFIENCSYDSDDGNVSPTDTSSTRSVGPNTVISGSQKSSDILKKVEHSEFWAPDKHEIFQLRHRLNKGPYGDTFAAHNAVLGYDCVVKKISANTFDEINDALTEGLTLSMFKDCQSIIPFKDLCVHLGAYCAEEEYMESIRIMNNSKSLKFEDHNGYFSVNLAMHWATGGDLRALVLDRQAEYNAKLERFEQKLIAEGKDPYNDLYGTEEMEFNVEPRRFTEDELVDILKQLGEAVASIHDVGLIHRDIQPRNIFLDKKSKVMLGNFGASKFFSDSQNFSQAQTVIGSESYRASEVFDTSKPYTQSIDVFSLGCVIYFMVEFEDPNFMMRDPLMNVLPEMKGHCSDFIFELTKRCWARNPADRPAARQLVHWLHRREFVDYIPEELDSRSKYRAAQPALLSTSKVPIRKRYEVLQLLATGGYGGCYIARGKQDQRLYVMKRVPCGNLEDLNRSIEEAVHLSYLRRGKYIVGFQDFFLDRTLKREVETSLPPDNTEICDKHLSVCIVMEYCEGGDLFTILSNHKQAQEPISEQNIVKWLYQSCCGLAAIHRAKTIHRDIKTGNLFLDEDQNILIGDFGVAKDTTDQNGVAITCIGTPDYMAPELKKLRPDLFAVERDLDDAFNDLGGDSDLSGKKRKTYDSSADIYSLGIVLYEMLTLEEPNYGSPKPISESYHPYFRELVPRMLHSHPWKRPQAQKICEEILEYWPEPERGLNGPVQYAESSSALTSSSAMSDTVRELKQQDLEEYNNSSSHQHQHQQHSRSDSVEATAGSVASKNSKASKHKKHHSNAKAEESSRESARERAAKLYRSQSSTHDSQSSSRDGAERHRSTSPPKKRKQKVRVVDDANGVSKSPKPKKKRDKKDRERSRGASERGKAKLEKTGSKREKKNKKSVRESGSNATRGGDGEKVEKKKKKKDKKIETDDGEKVLKRCPEQGCDCKKFGDHAFRANCCKKCYHSHQIG